MCSRGCEREGAETSGVDATVVVTATSWSEWHSSCHVVMVSRGTNVAVKQTRRGRETRGERQRAGQKHLVLAWCTSRLLVSLVVSHYDPAAAAAAAAAGGQLLCLQWMTVTMMQRASLSDVSTNETGNKLCMVDSARNREDNDHGRQLCGMTMTPIFYLGKVSK